ncbi:hypothetical protein [Streptomyces sp. ICBB 8177]|uniref:hypothetical protein n=1 Tax=Streptomyces sp. ICBB 8177 TaxID=563922 RepID=UPI000D673EF8|nr:hypothetical protein [Streptomyces sp. ICBB 8177]PWI45932.1 hypothetical protein CK485_01940 [Streptomyces sp. ICBB 8177]
MPSVEAPRRISDAPRNIEATPGSLPDSEVDRLSGFLESAEPLIISPGMVADPFSDDDDKMRVRVGVVTDGEWVWQLAWADYVALHKVAPPQDFIDHAREMNFTSPEITDDRLMEIIEVLGLPQPF